MIRIGIVLHIFIASHVLLGQGDWFFSRLADLPEPVTENSLCEFETSGNNKFVYSFGGISNPVDYTSFHGKVFKYQVSANSWETIDDFSSLSGRIGMMVVNVNNRIFLIGGKELQADSSFTTVGDVTIYNPFLDTLEVNANPIPIPVENAVSSVWKDSLILVVSGKSSDSITSAVQVFNPSFNAWQQATPVPDELGFKVEGASGFILGDTIFYYGGSRGTILPNISNSLIRGEINPDDPLDISWSRVPNFTILPSYRSICSGHADKLFWLGGSTVGHDFKGNNSSLQNPIMPNTRMINLNLSQNSNQVQDFEIPFAKMSTNTAAKLGGGNWLVGGGLDSLQQATNVVYLMTNFSYSDMDQALQPPTFNVLEFDDYYKIVTGNIGNIMIADASGRVHFNERKQLADLVIPKYRLQKGFLIFIYNDGSNVPVSVKKILN